MIRYLILPFLPAFLCFGLTIFFLAVHGLETTCSSFLPEVLLSFVSTCLLHFSQRCAYVWDSLIPEIICFLLPRRITLSTYCTVTMYFLYESERKTGALEKQTIFLAGKFISHAFMNAASRGVGDITAKQMHAHDLNSLSNQHHIMSGLIRGELS